MRTAGAGCAKAKLFPEIPFTSCPSFSTPMIATVGDPTEASIFSRPGSLIKLLLSTLRAEELQLNTQGAFVFIFISFNQSGPDSAISASRR